ncbi:MAG: tetratricopeptide repeat protein, partial [Terriglobales bacterium]
MLANLLRFLFTVPLDRLRLRRAQALVNSGVARRRRADFDGALRDLEHAIALDSGIQECWIELGNLLLARGESRRAADCYGRALALAPGSPVARFNLGLALREAGDIHEAIAQL